MTSSCLIRFSKTNGFVSLKMKNGHSVTWALMCAPCLVGSSSVQPGHYNRHARLTLNDCFALVLAEQIENCILLTSDNPLRGIAQASGIEVHGVLWTIDEMEVHRVLPPRVPHDALRLFREDDLVFLPADELSRRLRRLAQLF